MNASFWFSRRSHLPRPRAGGFAIFGLLLAVACAPSEAPKPVATATPVAVPPTPAVAPAGGPEAPAPAGSPQAGVDLEDLSDVQDFEWDLAEEAEGPDFEIDAATTAFFMPLGNVAAFKAKALNGTPPFTFTWTFGDGSPAKTGEIVKHQFTKKTGLLDVTVTGKDASGATSSMTLKVNVVWPPEYARRQQMPEEVIKELEARYPGPAPSTDPVFTPAPIIR